MSGFDCDVAIIGAGPSGIAAATALSKAGVRDIVVYEREAEIGGIPRHIHHPTFGLLVFKRPISGTKFIKALLKRCSNVRFETNTTVTALRAGGVLDIAAPDGNRRIRARHIILATGARETPRHPRLISGLRPIGVTTTGALQQFLYGARLRPFRRAVIVGTELVSFTALCTLRKAGIKPVAMIEENRRITAYRPLVLFARLMGVPIYTNTRITGISGREVLNQITVESPGSGTRHVDCDGLIFSGNFVGENTIARTSHLQHNQSTQIPQTDQNWLSSDPAISVIGNALHPADMGDQCYQEGLIAGTFVADLLVEKVSPTGAIMIVNHDATIKMTTPNIVRQQGDGDVRLNISLHVTRPYTGPISVTCGEQILYLKTRRCMPARRITLKNIKLTASQFETMSDLRISLGKPH
ncbi:MAG: FAD-dependent oxidoreductase [Alphaproteobacteria bacterium]|nr:FAD-dependent oxidoreductase [Alphaproteobacteria bacterium]